jgi:hypothetical protein
VRISSVLLPSILHVGMSRTLSPSSRLSSATSSPASPLTVGTKPETTVISVTPKAEHSFSFSFPRITRARGKRWCQQGQIHLSSITPVTDPPSEDMTYSSAISATSTIVHVPTSPLPTTLPTNDIQRVRTVTGSSRGPPAVIISRSSSTKCSGWSDDRRDYAPSPN